MELMGEHVRVGPKGEGKAMRPAGRPGEPQTEIGKTLNFKTENSKDGYRKNSKHGYGKNSKDG